MNKAAETVDFRELRVLEELDSPNPVTQRELARKVGIALGLANSMLKGMTHNGLIKVRNLDAKRLAYSITPHGMQEKTRLAYRYMERTVDFYKQARYRVKHNLLQAQARGVRKVAIYRINEMAEIVYLTVRELGLELVIVASPGHSGETWLGLPVQPPAALQTAEVDAIIITDFEWNPGRYPELAGLETRILWMQA